jgi:D-amino peptidase
MADDTNAAIRGARAGGATQIVVNDSMAACATCGSKISILCATDRHSFKRYGMMEGLDESFDAAIFIGYHAQAGSPNGLFAHTGSGIVADVRVNGRSLGEGGLNTLVAGWFGVPVVLVTGDNVAVEQVAAVANLHRGGQARDQSSSRGVATACRGAQGNRGCRARRRRGLKRIAPQRDGSQGCAAAERHAHSRIAEILPGMRRPAPDTIAFETDTMPRAYALIRVLYRFINPE